MYFYIEIESPHITFFTYCLLSVHLNLVELLGLTHQKRVYDIMSNSLEIFAKNNSKLLAGKKRKDNDKAHLVI